MSGALVEQFRRGGVPRDLRLLAAQGALPLGPEDLLELLIDLTADADEEVQSTATATLTAQSIADVHPIATSRDTAPAVLEWVVSHRAEPDLREAALQNAALPDEVVERIAPTLPEALAELVVINQERLLRSTPLLVALESNRGLSNDQRRRLRELRESFHVGEQPAAAAPPPPPQPVPVASPAEPPAPEEAPLTEDEAKVVYLSEAEREEEDKVRAVQKIYRLNTAEKITTALRGTREERTILIKDPNRLVATAVLDNPHITESEIEAISAIRSISDEILRTIGNDSEWTKNYAVVLNLVRNPRTPLAIAMNLVSRLTPKDLRSIAVDRNVPEAIRKAAQRFVKGPNRS